MKKRILSIVLVVGLGVTLLLSGLPVSAADPVELEVGSKEWVNTWTEVEYLGGGKYAATIYGGHQIFFDEADGNTPKKYKLTDNRPDSVVIQSAQVAVEIFPYYATFYDVQHQEVRLEEERWVVQRLFKAPDTWRDVDAYNPIMTVEEYDESTGHVIDVSILYDTDYGVLVVTYLQREGQPLKHNIYFENTSGSTQTFRVVQKWTGIVGNKVNNKTAPAVTDESYLTFHDTNKPSKEFNISENLWDMVYTGEVDLETGDPIEKTDQCLQRPIPIDVTAGGMKADFIYGNWILTDNEILRIDPGTATLNNPAEDGYIWVDAPSCPFIYSWDGSEYVFDEEGITRHVIAEYQGSQYSRLASLVNVDGEYRIKIVEKLPETTYLDQVTLIIVGHSSDVEVYTGFNNQLFTIRDRILPLSATDDVGEDVLYLLEDDEVFWNYGDFSGTDYFDYDGDGIADATSGEDLYKYLEIEFPLPENKETANLILQPLEFSQETMIWRNFLGSAEAIEGYLHEVAVDGRIVNWFVQSAMFRIEVWDGAEWLPRGTVMEFPAHKEPTVVYPIDISDIDTETLKVRFVGTPNEGGLDYIAVDYSEQTELDIQEIKSNVDALFEVDGEYVVLNTGDEVELVFKGDINPLNESYTYFANINGYYRADSLYDVLMDRDELDAILNSTDYTFRYIIPKIYPNRFSPSYYEETQSSQGILSDSTILLADGTFKSIEDIKLGDAILSYDFENREVINSIISGITGETIEGGYLLINKNLEISPNTKICTNRGWVSASSLAIGDSILLSDNTYSIVTSIKQIEKDYFSWYLEAKEPHNFFVNNYLIHNQTTYTRYFEADYLNISELSGDHMSGYIEWDVSSIPDAAIITDTVFKYHGKAHGGGAKIREMLGCQPTDQPYTEEGAQTIDTAIRAGDIYVSLDGFPVAGESQSQDLGATADSDLEGKLALDWFVIGFTSGSSTHAQVYTEEYGSVNPAPTLYVEYAEVEAPIITAEDASDIAKLSAQLNSVVVSDGGEGCEVRFGYGTTSEAAVDFEDYDTKTAWDNSYTTGQHPFVVATPLLDTTTYFSRVQIKNSDSTVTSVNEITFDTLAGVQSPTNFRGTPTATTISLLWQKGAGATRSMVRFKLNDYPADDRSDGEELYFDIGSNIIHTDLTRGTTYFYKVWCESGGDWSASFDSIMVTTSAAGEEGEAMRSPTEPAGWMQSPNPEALAGIPFVYNAINGVADSFETPRASAWLFATLMMVALIAVMVFFMGGHTLFGAGVVVVIAMSLFVAIGLLPSWMIFIIILFVVGMGFSRQVVK